MPYTGKMLPAITGWWFLAILFVPTIVIFSIAQLLSLEGRKTRKQALSPKKERVLVLGASGQSLPVPPPIDWHAELERNLVSPHRRHREGVGVTVRSKRSISVSSPSLSPPSEALAAHL